MHFSLPSPIDNPIEMALNCFKASWRRRSMRFAALPMHPGIRGCLLSCYTDAAMVSPYTHAACGFSTYPPAPCPAPPSPMYVP